MRSSIFGLDFDHFDGKKAEHLPGADRTEAVAAHPQGEASALHGLPGPGVGFLPADPGLR